MEETNKIHETITETEVDLTEDERICLAKEHVAKQKKLKEMKDALVKDFKNNAQRLKEHPGELKKLEQMDVSLELAMEDFDMKIEETELRLKDFRFRKSHFRIFKGQAKFDWEESEVWLETQRDLIGMEIKKMEFRMKLDKKAKLETKTNILKQKADMERQIEGQEKRCKDAHKVVIKRLKEECKVPESELQSLKKLCTSPCCR